MGVVYGITDSWPDASRETQPFRAAILGRSFVPASGDSVEPLVIRAIGSPEKSFDQLWGEAPEKSSAAAGSESLYFDGGDRCLRDLDLQPVCCADFADEDSDAGLMTGKQQMLHVGILLDELVGLLEGRERGESVVDHDLTLVLGDASDDRRSFPGTSIVA